MGGHTKLNSDVWCLGVTSRGNNASVFAILNKLFLIKLFLFRPVDIVGRIAVLADTRYCY